MIVYLVTNIINNKQYVGYTTKTLEERKKTHLYKSNSKTSSHYFYLFKKALRKYGVENFKWEIIFQCNSLTECQEKEKYFIKKYNTISPNGYNLTEGGNGGIQSDETKEKISKSVKNYWENNKEKHNWSNLTSEDRAKYAKKAWKHKKASGYKPKKGYTISAEGKLNMSETKNEKNKIKWININTNEVVILSCTKMAEYTGLSVGTFNHIKNARQEKTKCGWMLFKEQGR